MLTLALNTALNTHQIVLFDDNFCEAKSWLNSKQSSDIIFESLDDFLKKHNKSKFDIKRIFVLSGPGPFTSLRTSITIGNTFAYGLKCKIYGLNIFDFLINTNANDFFDFVLLNSKDGKVHFFDFENKYREMIFEDAIKFIEANAFSRALISLSPKNMSIFEKNYKGRSVDLPYIELLQRLDFDKMEGKAMIGPEYFGEAI